MTRAASPGAPALRVSTPHSNTNASTQQRTKGHAALELQVLNHQPHVALHARAPPPVDERAAAGRHAPRHRLRSSSVWACARVKRGGWAGAAAVAAVQRQQ